MKKEKSPKTNIYILRGDPKFQEGAWGSKEGFEDWLRCKNSESEQEDGVPSYWTVGEALEDIEICDILTADISVLEWLLSHKDICSLSTKQWDLIKRRLNRTTH